MFTHLDDPAALGPDMVVVLLTFFYAVCAAMIFLAFGTAAYRQVNWPDRNEKPELVISPATSVLFSLGILIAFF